MADQAPAVVGHAAEVTLEVCVDNLHGLEAAIAGGADRIELCAALDVGGLTPTAGLQRAAARGPVPVYAMVRPRAGDFCYDAAEIELMLDEIDAVAAAGLQGVVLGASRADGSLDQRALERLLARARALGLGATLHRAIDLCPDLAQATRLAVDLGFERILTSGGAVNVMAGLAGLQRCFEAAAGRIAIMPGAGVSAENAAALLARLPLRELHASCSMPLPAGAAPLLAFGFESGGRRQTSRAKVAALKAALRV